MVSREAASPHPHHLELAEAIVADVRRHLARLGMMRGLVVVQLGANGCHRTSVVPAEAVRPGFLDDLGIATTTALDLIDDVMTYDTAAEAAVLVTETNPIDGVLMTFLIQSLEAVV